MGASSSRNQFEWSYTDEPHTSRRRLMLAKYPEIKQLFGVDSQLKFVVAAVVLTQIITCYLLKDSDWTLVLLQSYLFGGTLNHGLTIAIHNMSHNTAFGSLYPLKNKLLGIFANLPIAIPMSISFKKYHIEHHRYLGQGAFDTDIPTELEAKLFTSSFRKSIWLLLQPLFYAIRPILVYRKAVSKLEVINAVVQIGFNVVILNTCGAKGFTYLIFGTIVSMGWHPTAGHFISEHYLFTPGQETTSYYGCLNLVMYNVGYHVEHHDFPFIPSNRLPLVHRMAPEFYTDLQKHTSWVKVLVGFVFNPDLGPYARIKRNSTNKDNSESKKSEQSDEKSFSTGLTWRDLKLSQFLAVWRDAEADLKNT